MRCSLTVFCTLLLATIAPLAVADDERDDLASLMDETALAVARLDITAEEPATTFASLVFPDQITPPQVEMWRNVFQKLLTAAGVRYVDLILQVPDQLPSGYQKLSIGAVCVIPCNDAETAQRMAKLPSLLATGQSWRVAASGRYCLFGQAAMVESALATGHPARPDLEPAFAAAGDAPVALVLAPSADQRQALAALLPQFPAEQGGNLLRDWAAQAEWTTVAYDPDQTFRLVIRTASSQGAIALAGSLDRFLSGTLADIRALNGNPIQFGPMLGALDQRVEHNDIILTVDLQKLPPADNVFRQALASGSAAVERQQAVRHFKEIGIALQNHHDVDKQFPDAAIRDANGKPLLSWRVKILPFLDQKALYDEFHLDEPWDSEHNRGLIERMPDVYRIGGITRLAPGKTCIELPIGAATAWPEGRGLRIREFIDGTSNTILAVEADDQHAVVWTQPADLSYDPDHPAAGLGGHFGAGFMALSADGAVHYLPLATAPDVLRELFTPAGRESAKWPGQ